MMPSERTALERISEATKPLINLACPVPVSCFLCENYDVCKLINELSKTIKKKYEALVSGG